MGARICHHKSVSGLRNSSFSCKGRHHILRAAHSFFRLCELLDCEVCFHQQSQHLTQLSYISHSESLCLYITLYWYSFYYRKELNELWDKCFYSPTQRHQFTAAFDGKKARDLLESFYNFFQDNNYSGYKMEVHLLARML